MTARGGLGDAADRRDPFRPCIATSAWRAGAPRAVDDEAVLDQEVVGHVRSALRPCQLPERAQSDQRFRRCRMVRRSLRRSAGRARRSPPHRRRARKALTNARCPDEMPHGRCSRRPACIGVRTAVNRMACRGEEGPRGELARGDASRRRKSRARRFVRGLRGGDRDCLRLRLEGRPRARARLLPLLAGTDRGGARASSLLAQSWRGRAVGGGAEGLWPDRSGAVRAAMLLGGLVLSAVLLDPAGFRITAFVFTTALLVALGVRRPVVIAAFALVAASVCSTSSITG